MSENRSLAVLEILAHLSDMLPDKYLLGSADLPDDISPEVVTESELPEDWATLVVGQQSATRQLGDIVIAYETTEREAAAEGKTFEHHLVHLAVHGYLHLLGYDHESDRDAKKMERLEVAILARLNVPDPYLARDPAM